MSGLWAVRRWAAGVAGATVLLSGCTGAHAHSAVAAPVPDPAATVSPSLGAPVSVPPVSVPPASADAAEQEVRAAAEQGGEAPAIDRLMVTVDDGSVRQFAWPTADGRLCWGGRSTIGIARTCVAAKDLPAGATPWLHGLTSGVLSGGNWYTLFLANQEAVRRVTCSGSELEPTRAGTVQIGDSTWTLYTLITPWKAYGTMPAAVVRADGGTSDRLAMPVATPGPPKDDPRFRECA